MPSLQDLPPMERLAVEQALFSRLGEDVSTRNPGSLRAECDAEILGNYERFGAKSYDVSVSGQKVGTYSVKVGNGTPERKVTRLAVLDGAALESYAVSDECAEERMEYMALMARNFAEYLLETYGIVADGCEVVTETVAAQPGKVAGTTLRIDAEKVGDALAGYLPTVMAGMLGGGADA